MQAESNQLPGNEDASEGFRLRTLLRVIQVLLDFQYLLIKQTPNLNRIVKRTKKAPAFSQEFLIAFFQEFLIMPKSHNKEKGLRYKRIQGVSKNTN